MDSDDQIQVRLYIEVAKGLLCQRIVEVDLSSTLLAVTRELVNVLHRFDLEEETFYRTLLQQVAC